MYWVPQSTKITDTDRNKYKGLSWFVEGYKGLLKKYTEKIMKEAVKYITMVVIVHNFKIRVYFLTISNPAISFWHHIKNIFHLPFLISPEMETSQNLFYGIIEKQSSKLLNYSVARGKNPSLSFLSVWALLCYRDHALLKHYLSVKPMEISWILMRTVPLK